MRLKLRRQTISQSHRAYPLLHTYSAALFTVSPLPAVPLSLRARSGRLPLELELRVCGCANGLSRKRCRPLSSLRMYLVVLFSQLLTLLHSAHCFLSPTAHCSILKYASPAVNVCAVLSWSTLRCITAPKNMVITYARTSICSPVDISALHR